MQRSPATAAGLVICRLLGVLDIAGMAALGMANAPPVTAVLAGGVLGIVTVAAVVPAWRGHHGGMIAVVGSRPLSGLLGFPAFFTDKAPGWAQAVAGVAHSRDHPRHCASRQKLARNARRAATAMTSKEQSMKRHAIRWGMLPLATDTAVLAMGISSASAATPLHAKRTFGPLERVTAGGTVIEPSLVEELVEAPAARDPLAALTPREQEVLALIAQGKTDRGIAEQLFVTRKTVEAHVRSILAKLDLPDDASENRRVHAVLAFLRLTGSPHTRGGSGFHRYERRFGHLPRSASSERSGTAPARMRRLPEAGLYRGN